MAFAPHHVLIYSVHLDAVHHNAICFCGMRWGTELAVGAIAAERPVITVVGLLTDRLNFRIKI